MTPRETPVSNSFEEDLAAEFSPLIAAGALASPGDRGQALLRLAGREVGAAATRYGGLLAGAQSAENFLLASSESAADASPRILAAIVEGNYKAPITVLAGTLGLSELHRRICGAQKTGDLEYDLRVALAATQHRLSEIERAKPPHMLTQHTFANFFSGNSRTVQGLASSLTAVAMSGRQAFLAHVGDGHAYRARAGAKLERLSDDHTLAGDPQFQSQIESHPEMLAMLKNVVRFCLGPCKLSDIQITRIELAPEDTILVCSSSLRAGTLRDEELHEILLGASLSSIRDELQRIAPLDKRPDLSATIALLRAPA